MLRVSPELYSFLSEEEQHLVRDALELLSWSESPSKRPDVHDFSFIVFPLAKAYEGFLKDFFFKIGLITQQEYEGRYFRIGRSFNPDLPPRLRDEEWIYDDASKMCSPEMTRAMWQIWIDARNHLFHYFPHERYVVSFEEARELCARLLKVMEECLRCQVDYSKRPQRES